MTDAIDLTPEQRKTLNDLLRRFLPGVVVWAYGSRVKWTARPSSDLDLVAFTTPAQRSHVADLKDALAESNLPFPVDLHVWDDVPERFREIIRKEYVVVQESKPPQAPVMADGWRTKTVWELQQEGVLLVEDGNHGEYRPRSDEFVSSGVAFIRAADMDGGRVLFESASKINGTARQRITKGIGAPGDVLLSHKGTVGKVALVHSNAPPFVCSPQTTFWRTLDEERLNRPYLYAFLRSPEFRSQLATRSGETDMAPYVSLTSQRGLSVKLPPIKEQRAIALILGTLDDKIELNRRMNETLEAMARALFKSWFVDFDPVRVKAEGRDTGLPKALADLFPNSFEDSELGKIPKGWEVGRIDEVTDFLAGYAFKSKDWIEQGVPVIKIGSVKPGIVDLSTVSYVSEEVAENAVRFRLSAGDLLIGMTGYVGEVGLVPHTDNPPLLNQRVGKFLLETPGTAALAYLYCLTRQPEFKTQVETKSHGTAQANVSAEGILSIEVVVPPKTTRDEFNRLLQPILDRILEAHAESANLAMIRDALLPKLISGELRVPAVTMEQVGQA